MTQDNPQPSRTADAGRDGVARHAWLDRLVELHVLADNGDPAAAAAARRWLRSDARAREVWDEVEQTCDQLRRSHPEAR
jgi:hypothetical protein